jgi:microcystin-dependent protein
MNKPLKPTVPPAPSRANPGPTFSQLADTFAAFQTVFADYMDAASDFVDDRADAALAAALLGTLPSLAGQAGRFTRVNPGGTALEFRTPAEVAADPAFSGHGAVATTITAPDTQATGGVFFIASYSIGAGHVAEPCTIIHHPADAAARASQELIGLTSARRFLRIEVANVWQVWHEIGGPIGAVQFFAMSTPPTGWLKANGADVSRTTYAALFAAIGTTYGVGDGTTTFNLPDLRGEFVRGWDDGRGDDTGRVLGSLQAQGIQSHSHVISSTASMSGNFAAGIVMLSQGTGLPSAATGGAETRPRNVALLACIKF